MGKETGGAALPLNRVKEPRKGMPEKRAAQMPHVAEKRKLAGFALPERGA